MNKIIKEYKEKAKTHICGSCSRYLMLLSSQKLSYEDISKRFAMKHPEFPHESGNIEEIKIILVVAYDYINNSN